MTMLLAEKTAVVTGAASGIGREISISFAEHGADVVVADVRKEPREGGQPTHDVIEERTSSTAEYVACDVSNRDDLESAMAVADELGGVDVLVNNAAIFRTEAFLEVTPETYGQLMDVNVMGPYFCSQVAARRMIDAGGGSIVNVSSIAGIVGNGSYVTYCVTKGAVRSMTYALADALGPEGIRVNAVHPGGVETEMLEDAGMDSDARDRFVGSIPSRRLGSVEDIAGAVLFLASDLASYVNGESLVVDGGYVNTG